MPSSVARSITISIRSPSRSLPIGPPASASGDDVADARAGGDAAEPRVGEHRDVLAERQVLQRAGDW